MSTEGMTPVQRVERIQKETAGVEAQSGVKSADRQFMRGILERRPRTLSVSQEKWLTDIEGRVFDDEDED